MAWWCSGVSGVWVVCQHHIPQAPAGDCTRTALGAEPPSPPAALADEKILPGSPQALDRLRRRGLPLIVVTNQPDFARGSQTREAVEQINQFLARQLRLDAVY